MSPDDAPDAGDSARPIVARAPSNRGLWLFGAALLVGGALVFQALENHRETLTAPSITAPTDGTGAQIAAPPELDLPRAYEAGGAPPMIVYPSAERQPAIPVFNQPYTPRPSPYRPTTPPSYIGTPGSRSVATYPTYPTPGGGFQPQFQAPAAPNAPEPPASDGSGPANGNKERVEAARFANPGTTIPKGTVIHAVLETALDSNRAGFARAVVSRDVMGFDGSRVLIPRGSRVIGEYKSDIALGQNRVLIQWQRLMRPDGVIINMDSPSTDPVGRAGVKGKVNSHFFQRFAGAILQSALDIGTQLATREVANNSVYIGLPGLSQGMAITPDKIPPTIKVKQGKSVSVFVARDLDFTKVS